MKYFDSVDHPCNGIWLGKSNKNRGYFGLAKGSNHGPNTYKKENNYEDAVGKIISDTYKRFEHQYKNNPDMMKQKLAEAVDGIKKSLYNGTQKIGKEDVIHSNFSVFKQPSGIVSESSKQLLNLEFIN